MEHHELVVDQCPDANGNYTIRVADGSPNGNIDEQPIATVYSLDNAERFVAVWNACRGLSTFVLKSEGIVSVFKTN